MIVDSRWYKASLYANTGIDNYITMGQWWCLVHWSLKPGTYNTYRPTYIIKCTQYAYLLSDGVGCWSHYAVLYTAHSHSAWSSTLLGCCLEAVSCYFKVVLWAKTESCIRQRQCPVRNRAWPSCSVRTVWIPPNADNTYYKVLFCFLCYCVVTIRILSPPPWSVCFYLSCLPYNSLYTSSLSSSGICCKLCSRLSNVVAAILPLCCRPTDPS